MASALVTRLDNLKRNIYLASNILDMQTLQIYVCKACGKMTAEETTNFICGFCHTANFGAVPE